MTWSQLYFAAGAAFLIADHPVTAAFLLLCSIFASYKETPR
ncbi:hypothetical protein [Micromonospora sp. NPDC048839]